MTSRNTMKTIVTLTCALLCKTGLFATDPVVFNARTAHGGKWSDAQTWEGARRPHAGDFVQVCAGHAVTYDVDSLHRETRERINYA